MERRVALGSLKARAETRCYRTFLVGRVFQRGHFGLSSEKIPAFFFFFNAKGWETGPTRFLLLKIFLLSFACLAAWREFLFSFSSLKFFFGQGMEKP